MTGYRALLRVAICAFVLMLGSCGRDRSTPDVTGAAGAGTGGPATPALAVAFPAPSALPHSVSGPPGKFDRYVAGSYFETTWPYKNIQANGLFGADFSPQWDPSQPDLAKAAYGIWHLQNMAGYSGKKRVHLLWDAGKAPPASKTFVGVANITHDRWDWFSPNALDDAYFSGNFSDYTDSNENMYVAVLLLDNQTYSLGGLMAGDSFISEVYIGSDLNADPAQNVAPLTVNFIGAGGSAGSSITHLDWDFDNDGIYDDAGTNVSHTFNAGPQTVKLRGTDAEGAMDSYSINFVAVNPANQAPVAFFETADPINGSAPLLVHFDASGSSDPDGTITKYEWDFDEDQNTDYTSTSPLAQYVFARAGTWQVGLDVTDNDFATTSYTINVTVTSGWNSKVVDSSVNVLDTSAGERQLDIGLYGVSPAAGIVYHDNASQRLRFIHSTNPIGSQWSTPTNPSSAADSGYCPRIAKLVSGAPIIAYGKATGTYHVWEQYVVTGTDDTPSAWNAPVLVASGTNMGFDTSLAVINTLPALAACTDDYLDSNLKYVLCSDATGSVWTAPQLVRSASCAAPELGVCASGLFKHPAISYVFGAIQSGFQANYSSASDIDGTAWNAPAQFTNFAYNMSQATVDGNPAQLAGMPSPAGSSGLVYRRASDADGTAWGSPVTIGIGGEGDLFIWNGKPAVVFHDPSAPHILVTTAHDADGTSWDAPYIVADSPGVRTPQACMLGGNPVLVYNNDTEDKLYVAWWQ